MDEAKVMIVFNLSIHKFLPYLQRTHLIESGMAMIDLVLHIGDISYARGYAGVVSHSLSL